MASVSLDLLLHFHKILRALMGGEGLHYFTHFLEKFFNYLLLFIDKFIRKVFSLLFTFKYVFHF